MSGKCVFAPKCLRIQKNYGSVIAGLNSDPTFEPVITGPIHSGSKRPGLVFLLEDGVFTIPGGKAQGTEDPLSTAIRKFGEEVVVIPALKNQVVSSPISHTSVSSSYGDDFVLSAFKAWTT